MPDFENTLTIVVDDPDGVLTSFDAIKVERSISGPSGPFTDLTKDSPAEAGRLLGSVVGLSFSIVGQILQLIVDEDPQVDVQFTGTNPLTISQVITQLNTALGDTIATNESNQLALISTLLGTQSKIEIVGGSAMATLGFTAGQRDIGRDVHIPIVSGQTSYTYVDEDGHVGYHYRTRYRDTVGDTESSPGAVFQAGPVSPLAGSNLCLVSIDLVDASGIADADRRIVFYPISPALESTTPPNIGVALGRKPIVMTTNESGHGEVNLVRGLQVRVVFEGTSLIREITIPDAATLDLLAAIATAPDIYNVAEQQLPAAPRRTI